MKIYASPASAFWCSEITGWLVVPQTVDTISSSHFFYCKEAHGGLAIVKQNGKTELLGRENLRDHSHILESSEVF